MTVALEICFSWGMARIKRKQSKRTKSRVSDSDWRTTDRDEIERRKYRAESETFGITNLNPRNRILSDFQVDSDSGLSYEVEIRGLGDRRFWCSCVDFNSNGLGTCKHVEAVLLLLQRRFPGLYRKAEKAGPDWPEIELSGEGPVLRMRLNGARVARSVKSLFEPDGRFRGDDYEEAMAVIRRAKQRGAVLRISREIDAWLEGHRRERDNRELRREYEQRVQSGEWPQQETKVALFPYQREGMLHLVFRERALLADEMGLGKTIQAIAACTLLHRLEKARRVLIVAPASLKSEWEEQIRRFSGLPLQLVYGARRARLRSYRNPNVFFTIVNYEQMRADSLDVNEWLQPDVVILDEAQRIKNWNTKTAQAVKRLKSRYAFVLTGTPIENKIDDLHSLMSFIDPKVLGPLFRFNREYYVMGDNGRPKAYCNLPNLHERVRPYMLRRRKRDVENELPERTDHTRFVELTQAQVDNYVDYEMAVKRLACEAQKRPLTREEMEILQMKLAMMRMTCDTNYILDQTDRECPKLKELAAILEDVVANDSKVIVFSEWERMLRLVREHCDARGYRYAWHTGSVPQKQRRGEINAFKDDPECRIFLSTDSGSTGLNLQNASIVVNCDLPWNPAKLEQRIARAWRKHQSRAVTVYNLVSAGTIEHEMLGRLANKQALADFVLDRVGEPDEVKFGSGYQAFFDRLEQLITLRPPKAKEEPQSAPVHQDPAMAFAEKISERLGDSLVTCEERFPVDGYRSVVLVVAKNVAAHEPYLSQEFTDTYAHSADNKSQCAELQVIDAVAAEAIARLEQSGLLAPTFRANRPLSGHQAREHSEEATLSTEQMKEIKELRESVRRNAKMAKVLSDAEFRGEARPALTKALLAESQARAIESLLDKPANLEEALLLPHRQCWSDAAEVVGDYLANEEADPCSVIELLHNPESGGADSD